MRAQESIHFGLPGAGISATPANFQVNGGLYQFSAVATTWGTATLNALAPDGSTLLSTATAQSANGGFTVYLAPGTYQLTLSGVTGLIAALTRIPSD